MAEKAIFNRQLSKMRVRAEQVFGQTNERFSSLKNLRVQIHDINEVKRAFDWVVAALGLHNFCHAVGDYEPPSNERQYLQDPELQPAPRQVRIGRGESF